MSDKRIKHTKNYRLFERCADNRACDATKRKPLLESMKQYGWIPSFPMVCRMGRGGKLLIEDGQHRFAIAQGLGIEVFYVLEDMAFDVAVVNSAQKTWLPIDYAQRYALQGNKDYVEALEFRDKYHLPVATAFALLSGTVTRCPNRNDDFKSGNYKIKDRQWAHLVASIYAPFASASPNVRNARFLEACMAVGRVNGLDTDRLIKSMQRCRDKLVSYSTKDAYLDMLEDIYNDHRRELVPLKVQALNAMKERNPAKKATPDSLRKSA